MDHVIAVDNETSADYCRITKEGRKLTYRLTVLQQPEKARACGSGAKSSADRRPVDPPPIVELKIFEGDGAKNDITFTMNANYFLFATLEQARPIAQGRVQQDGSKATVLTGTPVSGLVYLDRPHPAGYFLFPDLSVRHEGKYRLSFNLYEELKEDKDEDQIIVKDEKDPHTGHVTHRLEVKSRPFIVYSAKKFPGLNQSTELSRTVAEQGCRVRIRRDARVRKRGKHGQDTDGCVEGPGGDMYTTPTGDRSQLPHRQRSSSVESHRSIAPALSRRSSDQALNHSYHQGPPPGHNPASAAPQGPYSASYGGQHPMANYPPAYYSGPSYNHSVMAPPQHTRQSSYQQQPMQQSPASTHSHRGSMSHPVTPVSESQYQFGSSVAEPRPGVNPEYRPTPGNGPVPAYHYGPAVPHAQAQQYHPPPPHVPSGAVYHHEHLKDIPSAYGASYQQGNVASHRMLPALNTGNQIPSKLLEPASPASAGPSPVFSEGSRSFKPFGGPTDNNNNTGNGKRSYGQVFDTLHMDGPMRAGARPMAGVAVGHTSSLRVDHDEAAEDSASVGLRMSYKRADGRQITKSLPYDH